MLGDSNHVCSRTYTKKDYLSWLAASNIYMQLQGIEFMPEQEGVQEEGYAKNNEYLK